MTDSISVLLLTLAVTISYSAIDTHQKGEEQLAISTTNRTFFTKRGLPMLTEEQN
jgi:hypothetical protein